MHGSIQTGRAIQASQGPQATRLDLKQQNMGAGLRSANAMTIEMQVKAPYLGKRKFEIFGRFKGKSFNEKISGDDLKWDGAIWTRNTVTWDSLMGLNLQQKEMIATQGKISKLWDSIYAMELVGVDDPIGMQKRIEASDIHDAEVQAKVQGILGGGGAPGGAPPGAGGGGGRPPTSPGGGGQPPSPPAPQQMVRPPALAAQQPQGLPTGVPSGISTEAMKKALADVADKLHGPVWAVGGVAINGQSAHPQLLVADYRDAATVMRTLKPLVPGLKVQAAKKETPPEAVRVA
ncbi:MAG TPA: hypothetical protein VNL71_03570, partial [Chloroflexota bacterium]|nr:hypothetical protein [Chloroflexota bacterium]